MAWSITLIRVAGSEIRIHITFLLLLAWIGIAQYVSGGLAAAGETVAFVLAVFACVTLHELGHALAARRYGIATPDITLLPIGGLARLSRLPEKPSEEIVIALAGPAVNVVIAFVLVAILGFTVDPANLTAIDNPTVSFAARLAGVNVFLVLFNLIPAFPMDGGRVLRAALAARLGRRRATEIAARIGQGTAFAFGFIGLFTGNAILVFIAIFVYIAASAEAGEVGLMEAAGQMTVDQAMISNFERLGVQATVGSAAEALIRTTQGEFPIVDGGDRLRGFVTRDTMIRALQERGAATSVLEAMIGAPSIETGEKLSAAIRVMQTERQPLVGVTDHDDRLIGYISQQNLAELMMLEAVDWHGRSGARPPSVGRTGEGA